ncbi:MAG TPA: hypothetical protein VJ831_06125, partial [Jatrophihabitantaceae bacterium]|nr:hypothetical protein [Jatrophihabitantaceae bacterium]
MPGAPELADLLRQAKVARAARDDEAARAAYAVSFDRAREAHDVAAMSEAALGLAAVHAYGMHPGRVPAFLREAHSVADGDMKVRLAVAIVRAWAYSGSPERGLEFATEAVAAAEQSDDPALLAEALDAQLLVNWGPDDYATRLAITARLEDTVAYVADVEARQSAYLWRLTAAVESLDLPEVTRQLRALDRLAVETGSARVRFFASARNAMHAIVVGDLDAARMLHAEAAEAGAAANEADAYAIDHLLLAEIARRAGDTERMRLEAAHYEEFGSTEGAPNIVVEAAELWLLGGELEHAHALMQQVAGGGLAALPRNSDWIRVVTLLTQIAAATGEL